MAQNHHFLLRTICKKTGAFVEQSKFSVHDAARLMKIIGVDRFELGSAYRLEPNECSNLVQEYSLPILNAKLAAEILNVGANSKIATITHTGQELALMLQKNKPLAAFVEVLPNDLDLDLIPESSFAPYVSDGTFVRYEYFQKFSKDGKDAQLHRVLYALAGEEWRLRAHEMIWRLADKYGWNKELEKIEGFLLGYEGEVDTFFLSRAAPR